MVRLSTGKYISISELFICGEKTYVGLEDHPDFPKPWSSVGIFLKCGFLDLPYICLFIVSSVGPGSLHFKVFPADYDTST